MVGVFYTRPKIQFLKVAELIEISNLVYDNLLINLDQNSQIIQSECFDKIVSDSFYSMRICNLNFTLSLRQNYINYHGAVCTKTEHFTVPT